MLTFDKLENHFKTTRNLDLYDLYDSLPHFRRWHKAMGYPLVDPNGKDVGSSQIWYAEYQRHPDGESACPDYFNFWHWLLDVAEKTPWTEHPVHREKTIILDRTLRPKEFDEARFRSLVEPFLATPEGKKEMERIIRRENVKNTHASKVLDMIEEDFGLPLTLTLRVDT